MLNAQNNNVNIYLSSSWDDILYNMIDYPSIEPILKNFSQNFIAQLPFLDEGFVQKILF